MVVKPYLYKALRRKIVSEIKKITRQLTALEPTVGTGMPPHLPADPSATRPNESSNVVLTRALHNLPARQREVLTLVFFENLTREEAAEVMGVDTRTVYSLTWRAIKTLRKDLVPVSHTLALGTLIYLSMLLAT